MRAFWVVNRQSTPGDAIALLLPCPGFLCACLNIWHPPVKAWASEGPELNVGHIEPAAVFGSMVDFQPARPELAFGRKGLIERADPMCVEVITDQPHPLSLWVLPLEQVADLCGPVHSGLALRSLTMRTPLSGSVNMKMWLSMAFILVVDLLRLPGGSRERLPGLWKDWTGCSSMQTRGSVGL